MRSKSREEIRVEHMELRNACVEIDAIRATTVSWTDLRIAHVSARPMALKEIDS